MNKYKLGHSVKYKWEDKIHEGVIIGVDKKKSSCMPYLVSNTSENPNNFWTISEQKESFTFYALNDFPNDIDGIWVREEDIIDHNLPKKDTFYTVRDTNIEGKKMIFLSSGKIQTCNVRENAQLLLSNFNGKELRFEEDKELCFRDNPMYEKISRYFYPSPQKDIDELLSYQDCSSNTGQLSMKGNSYIEENKENMKNKVSRAQLREIHNIACSTWKENIASIAINCPFDEEITLSEKQIGEMFDAATPNQLPVLEKIFGKRNLFNIDVEKNIVTSSNGVKRKLFSNKNSDINAILTPHSYHPGLILVDPGCQAEIVRIDGFQYIKLTEKK